MYKKKKKKKIGVIACRNQLRMQFFLGTWYKNKRPVYIFAFGAYNSKQVNVSGIQIFRAQFLGLYFRKVMLNAANIYLFGIKHTKGKYIYRSVLNVR